MKSFAFPILSNLSLLPTTLRDTTEKEENHVQSQEAFCQAGVGEGYIKLAHDANFVIDAQRPSRALIHIILAQNFSSPQALLVIW